MAIVVQYNPDPTLLSRAAQQVGISQGRENQLRYQQQLQQQDLDNAYRDRTLDTNVMLAREAQANQLERDELNDTRLTDRMRLNEEMLRERQAQEFQRGIQQYEYQQGAEYEQREMAQILRNAPPEAARELHAIMRQRSQLQQRVDLSPEQMAPLMAELDQRIQGVIQANPTITRPPTAQEQFEQAAIRDEQGTVIGIMGDDGPEIFQYQNTREGQREIQERYIQQERLKLQGSMFDRLVEAETTTGEDGMTRPPSAQRIQELWRLSEQMTGGASIAPGESGGMPVGPMGSQSSPLEQAAQALGIDLSRPATPEARARIQQYMAQQQQPETQPQMEQSSPEDAPSPEQVFDNSLQNGLDTLAAVQQAVRAGGVPASLAMSTAAALHDEAVRASRVTGAPVESLLRRSFRSLIQTMRRSPVRL